MAWGRNNYGQLDVPTTATQVMALAAGRDHTLGLRADCSVVGWGRNDFGQCAAPEPNTGFVAIAAGALHSVGLRGGRDGRGEGGTIGSASATCPRPTSAWWRWQRGDNHSLALRTVGDDASVPAGWFLYR